jgi:hypothetical protein
MRLGPLFWSFTHHPPPGARGPLSTTRQTVSVGMTQRSSPNSSECTDLARRYLPRETLDAPFSPRAALQLICTHFMRYRFRCRLRRQLLQRDGQLDHFTLDGFEALPCDETGPRLSIRWARSSGHVACPSAFFGYEPTTQVATFLSQYDGSGPGGQIPLPGRVTTIPASVGLVSLRARLYPTGGVACPSGLANRPAPDLTGRSPERR